MTKNNSKNLSAWRMFVKNLKKILKTVQKPFQKFSTKYPNVTQMIQLSFIYFFALIDLSYAVLNNIFSLGYIPQILRPLFPLITSTLQSPILKIWASPEKVFFLSYVVIEFMIIRSAFNLSKLVKYNVLLIFAVLMIQGLVISYWDLLFHRQIAIPVSKWAYDQGALIFTDKNLAVSFFTNTFVVFMLFYLYLFYTALNGRFPQIRGMEWLTDSIAFWLRIKTPSMRFGKRKKKKDEETSE